MRRQAYLPIRFKPPTLSVPLMRLWFLLSFGLAVLGGSVGAHAADPLPKPMALEALPPAVAPSPELRAAAAQAGWSAGPLVFATEPGVARKGDAVIALITLWSKDRQKQWLVRFEIDAMTEQEKKTVNGQLTAKVSLQGGESWEFSDKPTLALNIRTLGPYVLAPANPKTAAKDATDKATRAFVNEELLALGLNRSAWIQLETKRTGRSDIASSLPIADQKAGAAGLISLLQFFLMAQRIPGLSEIMREVVDLPSVWTIVKSMGKISPNFTEGNTTVAALDPAGWGLPARPLYRFPFGLGINGKPCVNSAFFVIAPEPPLLTTAGILGFTAESPSRKDRRMLVQIVATERGTAAGEGEVADAAKSNAEKRGAGDGEKR